MSNYESGDIQEPLKLRREITDGFVIYVHAYDDDQ